MSKTNPTILLRSAGYPGTLLAPPAMRLLGKRAVRAGKAVSTVLGWTRSH